jgi:hypothetical protein
MIESGKKFSELEIKLKSKNNKVVSDAVISLRNGDPFRGAIGLLATLFDTTNDLIIKDLIINFMNDIKEPEARLEVVNEIMKPYNSETITMLVSSCWQSGLDYSGFAVEFAEIFIRGDYLTALECFTVMEESVQNMPDLKKSELINLLEKSGKNNSAEKYTLLQALITILK